MGLSEAAVSAHLISLGITELPLAAIALGLAHRLDECTDDRAAASIAKELRTTLEKIDGMPTERGDSVDELSAKRDARRADAKGA